MSKPKLDTSFVPDPDNPVYGYVSDESECEANEFISKYILLEVCKNGFVCFEEGFRNTLEIWKYFVPIEQAEKPAKQVKWMKTNTVMDKIPKYIEKTFFDKITGRIEYFINNKWFSEEEMEERFEPVTEEELRGM